MDQNKIIHVKDIMTREVISVGPDTPLLQAAKLLSKNNLDGVPVVDHDKKLVGLLTEYDLINQGSLIDISILNNVLKDINPNRSDMASHEKIEDVSSLLVSSVMNKEPIVLKEDVTFEEAVKTFREHHRVNPIPVVNDNNIVVGILSRFDILRPLNVLGYGVGNQ